MNDNRMQQLASARGLGTLPDDLLALVPSPPDPGDRLASPDLAPPTGLEAALHARTRRGPEDSSTGMIREALARRPRELALFEHDTVAAHLPRASAVGDEPAALLAALLAVPPLDLTRDPAVLIERLRTFDLAAAWQLAQLETGRDILSGDVAAQLSTFAATLERAHCPRWALGHLGLLHHLGHADSAPRIAEILLDMHAWSAAIDFVASLGNPSLEAYVASRAPETTLASAGRHAWLGELAKSQHLAEGDFAALSRAELAHLVGLADLALTQGVVILDPTRFKAIIARYPTWRHAQRVFARSLCASMQGPEVVATVVDRYLASFGVDAQLALMLRPHLTPALRAVVAGRLAREALAFPDWVEPWRALARFAVNDLNAAMALARALR